LEDIPSLVLPSLFSVGDLICKNVKLLGLSQEKVAACKVGRYLGADTSCKQQKRDAVRGKNELASRQNENTRVTNGNVK